MSQTPLGGAVPDVPTPRTLSQGTPLRRVHGALGAVVLGGYVLLHVWQGCGAFTAREAWVDGVTLFPLARVVTFGVLLGMIGHVVTGFMLARTLSDDPTATVEPEGGLGLRRLQQGTGLVLLAFFAVHVVQAWPLSHHDASVARDGYVAVGLWLETPVGLSFYVAATTALCFHLAHGLSRVAVSFGWVRQISALRVARYVLGALGIALWCVTLHWVGLLANGVGMWPLTGDEDALPAELSPTSSPGQSSTNAQED